MYDEEITESAPTPPVEKQLLAVTPEQVAELVEKLKAAGLDNLREILEAFDAGKITPDIRDALLADLVDDLTEAMKFGLDVVITIPEPGESLSDLVIDQGLEALEPFMVRGLVWIGGAIHELFDRDADRLLRRIERKERQIEAETVDEDVRARKMRRLASLAGILLEKFPDEAHEAGWRWNVDGEPVKVAP